MKKLACLVCCWMAFCQAANATLIDFEGFGFNFGIGDEDISNGLEVGTSNGFEFTSSGDHFHFGSGLIDVPSNGTSILLQDRFYSITMSQVGGAAFSFLSGDFGEDNSYGAGNLATSILVTGLLSDGGSVTQSVTLDGDASLFQSAGIVGFDSVTSVTFQGIDGGFTLDNLLTGEVVTAVPAPASLALLGLGLAGLGLSVKRKRLS